MDVLINFLQMEDRNLSNIISIPLNFILIYGYYLICSYVLNIKASKKQTILYLFVSGLLLTFSNMLFSLPIYRILYLFLNIIFAVIILKIDILKGILMQCIILIIAATVETVLFFYFHKFIDMNKYSNIFYVVKYRIIIISSIMAFNCVLYAMVRMMKLKIIEFASNRRINILVVSLICMIVMSAQINQILMMNNQNLCFNFAINFIAMILFLWLVVSNLSRFSEIERYKCRIEGLELYNKTLLENQDKLRTFKHDYNNVVQAIGGYVISENLEGLSHFYKELMNDCQEVNRISMLNPEIINNPVIFNIISNKFFIARENKIDMNIDICMNLNEIRIKPYKLAKILGILLDNAIEAANECENKIINIIFREEANNNRQLMIIENTYKDQEVDIVKIFEKNYSTKKRNSGIGLWEVKNILSKTNNLNLYTTKNDKYFKQQLELYA